jgi:hypothetical protein
MQIPDRPARAALFGLSGAAGFAGRLLVGDCHHFGLEDHGFPGLAGRQPFPVKQGPFGVGGTLEAGVSHETPPVETDLKHEGQEILSWDGPADSLEPVFHLVPHLRGQRRHQDHIRDHEAAAGL